MKKYNKIMNIERVGKQSLEGKFLVISDKLDGANASFEVINNEVICYSRNNILNQEDTLRGFYDYIMQREELILKHIPEGCRVYGEWLVKHKIDYKEHHNEFYIFDISINDEFIFSNEDGKSHGQFLEEVAESINVKNVEIFYEGKFKNTEHILEFANISMFPDIEITEGIVIRSYKQNNNISKEVFLKHINKEFSESKKSNKTSNKNNELVDAINNSVTQNRMDKIILKSLDEGVFSESELKLENANKLLPFFVNEILNDIIEEDKDLFLDILDKTIENTIKKNAPVLAINYLKSKKYEID